MNNTTYDEIMSILEMFERYDERTVNAILTAFVVEGGEK